MNPDDTYQTHVIIHDYLQRLWQDATTHQERLWIEALIRAENRRFGDYAFDCPGRQGRT